MGALKIRDDVNAIIPLDEIQGPEIVDIKLDRSQFGRADSLRYAILSLVVDSSYEAAIKEIKLYCESKQEYPDFEMRTERFADYAVDLIYAIKSKRNFPGHQMLRQAKRHELNERVHEHFRELKIILDKIENIEIELRVQDLRSTVWVLKTASFCAMILWMMTVFTDIWQDGLHVSLYVTLNDFYSMVTDFLVGT